MRPTYPKESASRRENVPRSKFDIGEIPIVKFNFTWPFVIPKGHIYGNPKRNCVNSHFQIKETELRIVLNGKFP